MTTAIDKAVAKAAANRVAAGIHTEVERILAIPSAPWTDEAMAVEAERWTRVLRKHPDAPPLRPIQGAALTAAVRAAADGSPRGVFGSIPVGEGKTIITLLLPTVVQAERPLLLIPPSMRDQLDRDIDEWSRHYNFDAPKRMAYSELSQASATSYLDWFRPDLLICDEAHALRHRSAARVKRVIRQLQAHPECRVVLLSGTITGHGLSDYSHLLEMCLRAYTPLPLHYKTLEQWASVIDPGGEPNNEAIRAVWPLAVEYMGAPVDFTEVPIRDRQKIVREAYQLRLHTVPGVIVSRSTTVRASLYLVRRRPDVPDNIKEALRNLADKWELPAVDADGQPVDAVGGEHGEELVDAIAVARAGNYLSAGFFYRWDWTYGGKRKPSAASLAPGGGPPGKTPADEEWLERRSAYNKALRDTLKQASRAGYDSPMLVALAASKKAKGIPDGQHVGVEMMAAYRAWHAPVGDAYLTPAEKVAGDRWCDREPPPTQPVWLSTFLVDDAVAWAKRERGASGAGGAILWYQTKAMEQALQKAGIPTYGAGSDSPCFAVAGGNVVACSIHVHGNGKNLQAWSRALVIEPSPSGSVNEQLIGRCHRTPPTGGVEADEVVFVFYQHTIPLIAGAAKAVSEARYIAQTQGMPQKLCFATWTNTDPGGAM